MHIVQFFPAEIPPRAYGGIERVVFWLTRELLKRRFKVSIIASPFSQIKEICPAVNFIPISGECLDYRSLIPDDADVIHLHNSPADSDLPDLPFLVTEHGNRKRIKQVQNTVFLSKSHAECHSSTHFVYNGIPKNEYSFCPDKNNEMLFMAKLGWRVKNAMTAINLSMDTGTPLALAGGDLWSSKKIRGLWMLRWLLKKHLINCVGEVGGARKEDLLQNSMLLFYMVNWAEPFALAPHEALACGTPVLATPNGALPEYIKHGKNGYLVDSYSDACRALNEMATLDSVERKRMAEYCRESAFSIEDCVDNYLKYYEMVSNGNLYAADELAKLKFTAPKIIRVTKFLG